MRSKRMRSKKGKSKVDKIKRKSRRKVNSRTKMKKTHSRKRRVNKRSRIRKTKRRMRGGSAQDPSGTLKKMTDEEIKRHKIAGGELTRRKKLIDKSAETWFSENPGKLYDIALLDELPDGPTKEYTKEVFNSYNIRVIITREERELLPIDIPVIMWLMDWVNKNPVRDPHFSDDYNKIIGYIKKYLETGYELSELREEVIILGNHFK